jgi:hypothetical protein
LLIPRLNHDAPSSSRKIRLLGQATSEQRDIVPKSNQFFCQMRNDAFSAAITPGRNTLH